MRNVGYELRVGYMTLLSSLSYKDKTVFVYDEIADPDDLSQFYIVVSGQTSTDDSLKCGFSTIDLISFNIIAKYPLGSGTKKDVEMIADSLLGLAIPYPGSTGLSIPSLNIWDTKKITERDLIGESSSERIITKIITIQHKVNHI
ncbi:MULTISPECIES: hypothetical protein [unclassified Sphingobacterium]|uniref:hypothetical protein n=1 Tax=unclassified Sphingobacterium TaxID=2609468 RepID=UPI0020C46441|nr:MULTISPECIES: hypothetical protein [unclassified Sphingobacterium]